MRLNNVIRGKTTLFVSLEHPRASQTNFHSTISQGNARALFFIFQWLMGNTSAGAGSRAAHGPGDLITAGDRFRGGTLRTHRANSRSTRRPPLEAHAPAVQCSTGSRAGNFHDRVILSPAEIGTRPENSSRTNVRLGTARAAHLWGAIT